MGAQRVEGSRNRTYVEIWKDGVKTDEYPSNLRPTACVEIFIKEGWDIVVTGNRSVLMSQGPDYRARITRTTRKS